MRRTNVYLDEEQARLLRHLAVEEGRSLTDLVREVLNDYLAQRGLASRSRVAGRRRELTSDEWRSRFVDVLGRIRASAPANPTDDAIETEITAAREEISRSSSPDDSLVPRPPAAIARGLVPRQGHGAGDKLPRYVMNNPGQGMWKSPRSWQVGASPLCTPSKAFTRQE